ncbi:MAG: hypothetical protein ABEI76_03660 [Halobacteriales archaeon]
MSLKQYSTIDGTDRIDTEHDAFGISRRSALKGIAGVGLFSLVGIPATAGTVTASSGNVSLVQSDTDSRVTGHGYAPSGTSSDAQHFAALRDDSLFTAIDAPAVVNEHWESIDYWSMKEEPNPVFTAAANFIWYDPDGHIGESDFGQPSLEMVRVEETFELSAAQLNAGVTFKFGVDNFGIVYVNGTEVADTATANPLTDLAQHLNVGTNRLEFRGINQGPYASPAMIIYEVMGQPQPTTIALDIDVKPGNGDETDPINPDAKGQIPVAVYSTDDFDATTLDVSTLRFGSPAVVDAGDGASAAHGGHAEDVDDDGVVDLMLHFPSQDAGFADGDTEAKLVGQTGDGIDAVGIDAIRTVGGKGNGKDKGKGKDNGKGKGKGN